MKVRKLEELLHVLAERLGLVCLLPVLQAEGGVGHPEAVQVHHAEEEVRQTLTVESARQLRSAQL